MESLFVIDSWQAMKPSKDTSLDLIRTGVERKHRIDVASQAELFSESGTLFVDAREVVGEQWRSGPSEAFYSLVEPSPAVKTKKVSDYDAVFIRKDPPFDASYLALCLLLAPLEGKETVFFNSPSGLLRVSEKLSALHFPHLAPRTLVTHDPDRVLKLMNEIGQVVIKPPFDGSGRGVFVAHPSIEGSIDQLRDLLQQQDGVPVIAQEFLPEIKQGDVRVMLLDGKIVGAVGRVPKEGDFKANIAMGGTETSAELTPTQMQHIVEVGAFLVEKGIIFAGLDFIGDRLIEINVTSPTLVQEFRRVSGVDVSPIIWDAIERRLASRRAAA